MIPVSTSTVGSGPSRRRTSGRVSSGTGARSSWRPPWLDSTTPSAPAATDRSASSGVCTPLISRVPGHCSRSQARSRKARVGSNRDPIAWMDWDPEPKFVKPRGSVVRKLIHHSGRQAASRNVLAVSCGGKVMPLRVSRCRAPVTGVSTVTISVSYPAAWARATRSSAMERSSPARYSWNQRRPSGPASATSSMVAVPMVDRVKGMPAAWAARTPAVSPSLCIIRVKPVGAMTSGIALAAPATVVCGVTEPTSRSTCGRKASSS